MTYLTISLKMLKKKEENINLTVEKGRNTEKFHSITVCWSKGDNCQSCIIK